MKNYLTLTTKDLLMRLGEHRVELEGSVQMFGCVNDTIGSCKSRPGICIFIGTMSDAIDS